ncbi:MAG: ABC-F family ATP-binding cassette domain-containing protein [Oscillospiraceae bacterium]
MVLLTGESLNKTFTERKLLDNTGFSIESGDKIGIIGVNGTGKTTLLRILAGEETLDSGNIIKMSGLRIGYLPQNPNFTQDNTILQQVMEGIAGEAKEYECKSILTKLELFDYDAKISTLSGGQKKRVILASALVHEVDLLILDEPTNHIDSDMVAWLESYLSDYKGAVLMVTHDRYFLDRVANRIFELDRGKLYGYRCNYTAFLEKKSEREDMTAASERKRQSLIRKEVEWIHQGPCARGTKSQYRIERLKKLQSESAELSTSSVEISSMSSRLGRKIIEINGISKSFGDKQLIKDFSYMLLRTDRVGIIGRNGIGKSTLLKIIMGLLIPDAGEVVKGETVKIGYFSQECEDMDLSMRPIDYVKGESNSIETPDGILTAAQLLEKFLFFSDLQYTTISRLSGGERRRLYLLKILMTAPNVLILDEPTNDLDIETLTILEDYLESFSGAVIMVSHDRYFLDKTATRIFSFENGNIKSYMGGYTDWLIQRENAQDKLKKSENSKPKQERTKSEKLKFTFKEAREFETIDQDIAQLEQRVSSITKDIEKSATDFVRLQDLFLQKQELENSLSEKMERWVYLNELSDSISALQG